MAFTKFAGIELNEKGIGWTWRSNKLTILESIRKMSSNNICDYRLHNKHYHNLIYGFEAKKSAVTYRS